jgi:hypothetical protein
MALKWPSTDQTRRLRPTSPWLSLLLPDVVVRAAAADSSGPARNADLSPVYPIADRDTV